MKSFLYLFSILLILSGCNISDKTDDPELLFLEKVKGRSVYGQNGSEPFNMSFSDDGKTATCASGAIYFSEIIDKNSGIYSVPSQSNNNTIYMIVSTIDGKTGTLVAYNDLDPENKIYIDLTFN